MCKPQAYICFLLGSLRVYIQTLKQVENGLIIFYFLPPPALCWNPWRRRTALRSKMRIWYSGKRPPLSVEVPHANMGWLQLNTSGHIFRQRGLCHLPYALPLSLRSSQCGWDLQMPLPPHLIGEKDAVKKSEPSACHGVAGMWLEETS